MADGAEKLPAYLPLTTFKSAIQTLRAHGLPGEIDNSAWASRSGADKTQIMSGFRFLGLIDEGDKTQEMLKRLVQAAPDSPDEKKLFAEMLRGSYTKVFELDLTTATPMQFSDAIGSYGGSPITKKRAARFFLKAAQYAGIPLSGHLKKGSRGNDETEAAENGAEKLTGNGKPKRKKRNVPVGRPPEVPIQQRQSPGAGALKTITLPNAGGTLTLGSTVNFLELEGDERELVYAIVDLMKKHEQKTKPASE